MKLLFSGASGFLGNNVRPLLEKTYGVTTIGLTSQDNYIVNIAKDIPELCALLVLSLIYIWFMKKYFRLHQCI